MKLRKRKNKWKKKVLRKKEEKKKKRTSMKQDRGTSY